MGDTPQKLDRGEHVVAYTIIVGASAEELYSIAANPHRHHELDGSGTVRSSAIGPREAHPGDRFRVDMKKFGLPYALTVTVTEAQPPQRASDADGSATEPGVVEWRQPTGHRWRWEFAPVTGEDGAERTQVTEGYDASGQQAAVRRALGLARIPAANAEGIRASLQKLHDRFA